MKLYATPGSPYARMARIMVIEKGLEGRVEVIFAKTRSAGSPNAGLPSSWSRYAQMSADSSMPTPSSRTR